MLKRGVIAKRPKILLARPLTRDDLACLTERRAPQGIAKTLRSHHHRIARLDAMGLPVHEILEMAGIGYNRLNTLRQTPAYQELVSRYQGKVDEAFERAQDEFATAATSNMLRAEKQVQAHLDESDETGELIPLKTLTALIADRADRFGYGKKNLTVIAKVGDELQKAMARQGRGPSIDGTVLSSSVTGPSAPAVISPPEQTPQPQGQPLRIPARRGF